MKNENLYKCSCFNRACVLKYFGCELLDIEKEEGKKIWCFKRSERMDEILQRYWQGKLEGNLVNFLAIQDFMKSSIYASN